MTDAGTILGFLALIGVAIGARLMAGSLDRDRIRQYVEKGGGRVLDIVWNPIGPGWWGSRERIYDVTYRTHNGKVLTATCKTTMFSGVYWTGNTPPSGLPGNDSGDEARIYVSGEAINCLRCGTRIPSERASCPKCGWSFTNK